MKWRIDELKKSTEINTAAAADWEETIQTERDISTRTWPANQQHPFFFFLPPAAPSLSIVLRASLNVPRMRFG